MKYIIIATLYLIMIFGIVLFVTGIMINVDNFFRAGISLLAIDIPLYLIFYDNFIKD